MLRVLVLYATPSDPAAFDLHYSTIHAPLAKKLPNLLKYEYSSTPIFTPTGPSSFHAVATLHFADMPTLQASMSSPEGQAAAADAGNIMAPGSQLLIFDTTDL